MMDATTRKAISQRLRAPGKKQEPLDNFVGVCVACGLAAIALAWAVFEIIDIARSGGV